MGMMGMLRSDGGADEDSRVLKGRAMRVLSEEQWGC